MGFFKSAFPKKAQCYFPKIGEGEGGGSKAVCNFSENSSDLVAPPFFFTNWRIQMKDLLLLLAPWHILILVRNRVSQFRKSP